MDSDGFLTVADTAGHFRWSQGAVELRLVDQREYSTYSWVQRAASNHGAISDGETLVLGV